MASNAGTENYTLDVLNRLTNVTYPNGDAAAYSYDANGNLIVAGDDTYTWDWANRMTGATVAGNSASYTYDAFDVRVSAAVNGATSSYLWAPVIS